MVGYRGLFYESDYVSDFVGIDRGEVVIEDLFYRGGGECGEC